MNTQNGFVGIVVAIVIALAAVGGGAYLYTKQTEVKPSVETNVEVNSGIEQKNDAQTVTTQTPKVEVVQMSQSKSFKTFTNSGAIYTVTYPATWTYSEGELAARFETVAQGGSQTFDIGLDTDIDYAIDVLSPNYNQEKVTFGSNTFTKFYPRKKERYTNTTYLLSLGKIDTKTAYLSVLVDAGTKINEADFKAFMASIKVDPSKIEIISKRLNNIAYSAAIRASVSNLRASAELYSDDGVNYTGICNGSTDKAKAAKIDVLYKSVLDIVAASAVYCNSSEKAFVYAVKMPSGDTVCSDTTGFAGVISQAPKVLSCE